MLGEEIDIEVRSHRLHGQRFGSSSSPLVLGIHGLSLNMRAFDYLGERIGDALQLVALDLRGRGNSPPTAAGSYGWDNHAHDVLAVADVLGHERFAIVGQSMGGSVAMKVAEIAPARVGAVVLVDIAGRVDRGAGELIGSTMAAVHDEYDSVDAYLTAIKAQGLVDVWNDHWERCYRYGMEAEDGRVRARVDREALAEDRRYGATKGGGVYVYERWKFLTMPTLLVRATKELRPGVGHVVPDDDRASFLRDVPTASVVEVDATHLSVNTHPRMAEAIRDFLASTVAST